MLPDRCRSTSPCQSSCRSPQHVRRRNPRPRRGNCGGQWPRRAARARRAGCRFLTRRRRFITSSSCWGGPKTGPNPTDRARPGSKHRSHRRQRHTARRDPDWRERQRCHAVAAADRRDSIDSRPARPPDSTASRGLCRSRIWLRATSVSPAQSRYPTGDRKAPDRTRQRTRQISLVR